MSLQQQITDEIEDILARQPAVTFRPIIARSEVEAFREQGFTSIARITSEEEVAWLRELYDWLFADKSRALKGLHFDLVRPYESEGQDRLPQIIAPEQKYPQLKETGFWRNGRAVAARLLGVDEAELQGWGHMIRKPARIGEPLPWHQDEAYWDPALVYRALGSWLPLDDATVENGCMSFIPGSHSNEVLPHRHVGDDPSVHALFTEPDPADIARAVPVPVPAGGAVFHHSRTLHSSGPNTTSKVRRAYANEWQLAPVKAEVTPERPWIEEHKQAWAAREIS
jgi:hypothetical protein